MAEAKVPPFVLELVGLERLYVQKALDLYVESLRRSLAKEIPGTDVHRFRTADMSAVRAIADRVR